MLFVWLLLSATFLKAQNGFIITYPSSPENLTVCNGTSKLTVQLDAVQATTTPATVTVQLAPGVEYVAGSVALVSQLGGLSIVENGGTASAPVFRINPSTLAAGNRIVFSINRRATCGARTHLLNNGIFTDNVQTNVSGVADTKDSPTYQVAYPVFSFTQPAPLANAVIGQNANRTFTIRNGGQGAANAVHFTITNNAGVVTNSVTLSGGTGSTGVAAVITPVNGVYTIPATLLSGGSFDYAESLQITENFTVLSCNAATSYAVGWGCDATPANWCDTSTGTASVNMAAGTAALTVGAATKPDFVDSCTPFTTSFTFTNSGSGNVKAAGMYNLKFRWGNGQTGTLVATNFDMTYLNFQSAKIGSQSGLSVVNGTTNGALPYVDILDLFTADPDGVGIGLEDLDGDGFFDDLAPGKTATVEVLMRINCSRLLCNNELAHNYLQWSDVRFTTMCNVNTFQNSAAQAFGNAILASRHSLSNKSYAPATVYGGTPFTARFSMGYHTFSNSLDTNNTRYSYEITLPAGFSVVGSTVKWYAGQYMADPAATSSNISFTQNGQVLTVTSPNRFMGWFEVQLVYTCGTALTNVQIPFKLKRLDNIVTGCRCNEEVFCSNVNIGRAWCATPCSTDGPGMLLAKVERANNSLGWTDASLTTRQSRANISAYDLAKALYLDDIDVYTNGTYRASNATYNQFYLYFGVTKINPQAGNIVTPNSIDVTVKRGGATVGTYNITNFTGTGSDSNRQIIRWNLSSLIATAGLQPNDVIETVAHYSVSSENLPLFDQQTAQRAYFYNVDGAGAEIFCDYIIPEMYLARTTWVDGNNSTNLQSCASGSIGNMTHYLARRFNTAGTKYLNEIRPGFLATKFTFTLPAGFALSSVTYYLDDVPGQGSPIDLTSAVTSAGGNTYTVNLPAKALNITVTNNYAARIDVRVTPTCNIASSEGVYSGTIDIIDYYYHFKDNPSATTVGKTKPLAVNYNLATKPGISLANISGVIQATKPTESMIVRLTSTGNTPAPYVWLAVPAATGVNVVQIVDVATGTAIAPTNYSGGVWFKIGDIASAATKDFRIDFTYNTCSSGSFNVIGGWNCAGYPADPTASVCTPYTTTMNFVVQPAAVQLQAVSQPTVPITLCTNLDYIFSYISAGAANIVNNQFTLVLPPGLNLTSGSLQVEYPAGSGNWAPVNTVVTANTYRLDLDTHPNYPSTGLPGTLNDGGNANLRKMNIRFTGTTTCGFTSGRFVRAVVRANKTCGSPASGNGTNLATNNLFVQGADPGYVLSTTVTNPNEPITSCDNDLVVNIRQVVILSSATGTPPTAVVRVIIPSGYDLVNTAPVCTASYCPTFISQGTDAVTGEKFALYQIPVNMQTGEVMEYQLTLVPNSTNSNGDYSVIVTTEDTISGLTCPSAPGGVCSSVTVQTSQGQYDFTLQCVCYEDPATQVGTVPSQHGITLLKRAGADNGNWPMIRQSAHTVLESNSKGFVITRVPTSGLSAIANPVVGMMVYDTTEKCLKIYTGPAATEGWRCYQRPACPD